MADHSTISRSSMKARKAGARDVSDWHGLQPSGRRRRRPGGLQALCRIFVVSWVLQEWNGSYGRQMETDCDARTGVKCLPGGAHKALYNSSEVPASESAQKKNISILDTFPSSPFSIPL